MTGVAIVIAERCQYCSRQYPLSEILKVGAVVICLKCKAHHNKIVEGNIPPECGECQVSFQTLAASTPGEQVSMAVHFKDGVYQMLCMACDAKYVLKRPDLYAATPFGVARKIR